MVADTRHHGGVRKDMRTQRWAGPTQSWIRFVAFILRALERLKGLSKGVTRKKHCVLEWKPWFGVESKSCGDQLENYYRKLSSRREMWGHAVSWENCSRFSNTLLRSWMLKRKNNSWMLKNETWKVKLDYLYVSIYLSIYTSNLLLFNFCLLRWPPFYSWQADSLPSTAVLNASCILFWRIVFLALSSAQPE